MKKVNYLLGAVIAIGIIIAAIAFSSPSEPIQINGHEHHLAITSEEQFVYEMVPHHQEAVDTSKEIMAKTTNQDLRNLADKIIGAQTKEITMMNKWKDSWYPESKYQASYTPMMPTLDGQDSDKLFLEGMILHHQMAIMMSYQVLNLDPREEVKTFAENIIKVQNSEIETMREMLKDY